MSTTQLDPSATEAAPYTAATERSGADRAAADRASARPMPRTRPS